MAPSVTAAAAAARSVLVAVAGFVAGLLLAALAMPAPGRAQTATVAEPPSRTRSVVVYGSDPCPAATGDEIVVCARQPESERYRIPKRFRGQKAAQSPAGNSFANKVRTTEDASRTVAGVPNSCSAVGAAGQTGCFLQMQNQAAAMRRQPRDGDDDQP